MNSFAAEFNKSTDAWYEKATVRYTPRIVVPEHSGGERIYPIARAIICEHPLVVARGKAVESYILTQAAYQFLYGVGLLETKFVIQCALDLIHNHIDGIDAYEKIQALTVLIDEGYHAYVALDYIIQMGNESGIKPLREPETNRKIDATLRVYAKLPVALKMDFQLLAITLAENVLTEEIAHIGREKEVEETFIRLMKDHVRDEGRHANYFVTVMKKRWSELSIETQLQLGEILPEYLDDFLGIDTYRGFEREVLVGCDFTPTDIECIISDTNSRYLSEQASLAEKTKTRLYRLLKHLGVLDLEKNQHAFHGRSYTI